MLKFLKERIRRNTPMEMITQELAIAHLEKLEAETAVDYAQSIVDYNIARINRLNQHITTYSKEKAK